MECNMIKYCQYEKICRRFILVNELNVGDCSYCELLPIKVRKLLVS